ncbi:TetR/AcrR family transcriptional regulator [Nocardioides korecus]
MAPAEDRRKRRTQAALQGALRQLIVTKRYETITAAEVIRVADVGRSTFYAHFTDKDDLLLSALDHINAGLTRPGSGHGGLNLEVLFTHAAENRDLYLALSKGRAGQLFLDRLRDDLEKLLIQPAGHVARADRAALACRYEASAIVGVLTWWLDSGTHLTARQAARHTERLGTALER